MTGLSDYDRDRCLKLSTESVHALAEARSELAAAVVARDNAQATMGGVADELRDLAETYLYNGDLDRPLCAGYDKAFDLADRLDSQSTVVAALDGSGVTPDA